MGGPPDPTNPDEAQLERDVEDKGWATTHDLQTPTTLRRIADADDQMVWLTEFGVPVEIVNTMRRDVRSHSYAWELDLLAALESRTKHIVMLESLREYVHHKDGCDIETSRAAKPCSCGLDVAWADRWHEK